MVGARGAVVVSVLGQMLLKMGATAFKMGATALNFREQLFDPHTLAGLLFYGLASPLYIVALRRIPLSVVMPFTAISYALAAVIGRVVFAETLGAAQIDGIALIVAGVLMMTLRRRASSGRKE